MSDGAGCVVYDIEDQALIIKFSAMDIYFLLQ